MPMTDDETDDLIRRGVTAFEQLAAGVASIARSVERMVDDELDDGPADPPPT